MDFASIQRQSFEAVVGDIGVASFRMLEGMKDSVDRANQAQLQVLEGVNGSINWLNMQLLDLRDQIKEQNLLLREMLRRDDLQQIMEEFIYHGQRMLTTVSDPACRFQPIHKALLLRFFILWVKNSGIGTELIRGLENKKAYGQMIDGAKATYRELQKDLNVRNALERERQKELAAIEAEREREQAAIEEKRRQEEEAARKEKEAVRLRKAVFKAVHRAISELGLSIGANSCSEMRIRFKTRSGFLLPAQVIDVEIVDDEECQFVLWFRSPSSDCEAIARSVFMDSRVLLAEDGYRKILVRFEVR